MAAAKITRVRGHKMRDDLLALCERIIEQGGEPIMVNGEPLIVDGKMMMKFPDASQINVVRQTLKDTGYLVPEPIELPGDNVTKGLPFEEAEDVLPLPPPDGKGPNSH